MKVRALYTELLRAECEAQARILYLQERGGYSPYHDDVPWEEQSERVREDYMTRVKVIPLFAS